MLPGYNTNGFAHHRLEDAIDILGELGCRSLALTLDVHHLDPFAPDLAGRAEKVHDRLRKHGMRCVVETGARFILDPRRKHQPTLLDQEAVGRQARLDFLIRCVEVAALLGADAVSFWSGSPALPEPDGVLFSRLVAGCKELCAHAAEKKVRLAFEPEPGMFLDTMEKFERLFRAVDHPAFGLTLDIGHLQCMNEVPMAPHIERWKDVLWNVHIEDMRKGVHDHLPFGEGEIDFPPVFEALREADYQGGLHVELSRHSHDAVRTATRALAFLRSEVWPYGFPG
jgi:sugar phosphate isomerase/epimerase